LYHRDPNALLVKEGDDAISASRYTMMMVRDGNTSIPPKPRDDLFYGGRASGPSSWMVS
jgi:hypothetical protein